MQKKPVASAGTGPSAGATAASSAAASTTCPDCMTGRNGTARYCEVCRYDFIDSKPYAGFSAATPVAALPDQSMLPAGGIPEPEANIMMHVLPDTAPSGPSDMVQDLNTRPRLLKLRLRAMMDASLSTEPDPDTPLPLNPPEKIFHLDLDEHTLGRQFEGRGICPEFVITDPGISRRHLKFIRHSDHFTVLELGSSNGTLLNGAPLEPGIDTRVTTGDQFILGMWTRIVVETR